VDGFSRTTQNGEDNGDPRTRRHDDTLRAFFILSDYVSAYEPRAPERAREARGALNVLVAVFDYYEGQDATGQR
jgi:hypothetical protein